MPSSRHVALFFVGMLLLVSIACDLSFGNPADTVATAEAAARVAGSAAQTAAAQAVDLGGTAAALATTEGSGALATVMAVATPHIDFLKEKLANIEPDADGNYRATLSEDEVNTVLRLRQLLTGDLIGAKIQSQEVRFAEGSITLTGSIVEPLPGEILVSMRPTVEAGQFQLEIEGASVAGQEAPPQVLEAAEDAISSILGEALDNLPAGVQLHDILVGNDELTIIGRKNDSG